MGMYSIKEDLAKYCTICTIIVYGLYPIVKYCNIGIEMEVALLCVGAITAIVSVGLILSIVNDFIAVILAIKYNIKLSSIFAMVLFAASMVIIVTVTLDKIGISIDMVIRPKVIIALLYITVLSILAWYCYRLLSYLKDNMDDYVYRVINNKYDKQ